jgi:N-acetylneuraminic acid mutarotase
MSHSSAASWEKLPSLPEPNAGFLGTGFGEEVVVIGGTNWQGDAKRWLDRILVFEPGKMVWREAGRLASPLAYAASGTSEDGFYFAGGSSGAQTYHTLSRLDRSLTPKVVATRVPPLVYASSAILDGRLYVIGGAEDQARIETMTNACWTIDLQSGQAARIADLPAPGLAVGAAVACGGRVFVFGGCVWDSTAGAVANLSSSFAFSPAENRWQILPPLPSTNRGLTTVALDDRHVLLAGGYKNDAEEFTDEMFLFDTMGGTYQPTIPLPYRALVGLVKAGDYLYCLGGEPKKKERTDAAYRLPVRALLKAR